MAVDSGATETVVSPEMLACIKTIVGYQQRMGAQYETADGSMIDNKGEKMFEAHTEDGAVSEITAQACDVNKSLRSVSKIVET